MKQYCVYGYEEQVALYQMCQILYICVRSSGFRAGINRQILSVKSSSSVCCDQYYMYIYSMKTTTEIVESGLVIDASGSRNHIVKFVQYMIICLKCSFICGLCKNLSKS